MTGTATSHRMLADPTASLGGLSRGDEFLALLPGFGRVDLLRPIETDDETAWTCALAPRHRMAPRWYQRVGEVP